MDILTQLITFLANPPGNFLYNLAVPVILAAGLQGAISQWRATGYPQSLRLALGLGLALTAQAVLLVLGIFDVPENSARDGRAAGAGPGRLWSSTWRGFCGPGHSEALRPADAVAAIISLLVLAGLALGALERGMSPVTPNSFNASLQSLLWSIGGLVVMLLGGIALLLRRPQGWGTGLTVAILGAAGFTLDLFLTPAQGDFSGVVRFLMLAGYPLLLTLPMRFPMPVSFPKTRTVAAYQEKFSEAQKGEGGETPSQPIRERRRYSTDPKTLQSLLALAAETDPNNINQYIASLGGAIHAGGFVLPDVRGGRQEFDLHRRRLRPDTRRWCLEGRPAQKRRSADAGKLPCCAGASLRLLASTTLFRPERPGRYARAFQRRQPAQRANRLRKGREWAVSSCFRPIPTACGARMTRPS